MAKRKVTKVTKEKRAIKEKQQRELWAAFKAGKLNYTFAATPKVIVPPAPIVKAKNYLMLIVDESGSMDGLQKQTIGSVNENLNAVRSSAGPNLDVEVSIHKFGGQITHQQLVKFQPIGGLASFDNYHPRNSTPLYDAIGQAIESLEARPDINDPTTSVLVVIVTDGYENASTRFNASSIGALVTRLQATKRWTFTVSGANIDLTRVLPEIPMANKAMFENWVRSLQEMDKRGEADVVRSMLRVLAKADERATPKSTQFSGQPGAGRLLS